MNIFIDATRFVHRLNENIATGIDRVDIENAQLIISHYEKKSFNVRLVYKHNSEFILINNKIGQQLINYLYNKWIKGESYRKPNLTRGTLESSCSSMDLVNGIIRTNEQFLKSGSIGSIYYNASHHGLDDENALILLKTNLNCTIIVYIHDIIPVTHPQYVRFPDYKKHAKRIRNSLRLADAIIGNSKSTIDSIKKFHAENCTFRVDNPAYYINRIGVDEKLFENKERIKPLDDYFTIIGTIEPRKNHILLLNIWEKLTSSLSKVPKLVIIGKRGWNNESVFNYLDNNDSIRKNVVEINGLTDGDVHDFLYYSHALLYPSFAEGWGMPVAEALTIQKKVICSNIPALLESGQGIPKYIDPIDGMEWYRSIISIEKIANSNSYKPDRWLDHRVNLVTIINELISTKKNKWVPLQRRYSTTPLVQNSKNLKSKYIRLITKLYKDPVGYCKDSKHRTLNAIGIIAEKYLKK